MKNRLLALASLAAWPLAAQFSFSIVQNGTEEPVVNRIQLGSAAPGDTLDTLFRIRNSGNSTAQLTALQIGGSGFSLANLPTLPATLLPDSYLDFTVRFQPAGAGSFSAVLAADGVSVFVQASGLSALTVYLDQNGARTQLNTSLPTDFGAVQRGSQSAGRFLLVNQTAQPIASTLATVGDAFQFAPGTPSTVALDPQASAEIDLIFAPTYDGPQQGILRVSQRGFPLAGSGIDPPLPQPILNIDLGGQAPASGMQPQASVRFDPAPAASGTGHLRIDFQSSIATAADDPAILFLPTAGRTIDFSVIEGDAVAHFGPTDAAFFQTGTTAGTIVITAELGDYAETATLVIPPQPVMIESVQQTLTANTISLHVTGFDNTRSLSQATFTFLRSDGSSVPPGAVQQDVSAAFQNYFANSAVGGSFELNAAFPITGSASLIDSVTVALNNSAGTTNWPQ